MELLRFTAREYDASFEIDRDCPVQAFVTVGGREVCFRARHEKWSFVVADHAGNLPSDGYRGSDGFYREGDHAGASRMPLRKAIEIIGRCLSEYGATRT